MKPLTYQDRVSLVKTILIMPILIGLGYGVLYVLTLVILPYMALDPITALLSKYDNAPYTNDEVIFIASIIPRVMVIVHIILYWIYKIIMAFVHNRLPFVDFEKQPIN